MAANSDPLRHRHLEPKAETKPLFESEAQTHNEPGRVEEQWVTLCSKAAVEQDPKKLLDLVSEINRLLDMRKKRLAIESTSDGQKKRV